MTITHSFVSEVADGSDTDVVRPIDWNDDHAVDGITTDGTIVAGGIETATVKFTAEGGLAIRLTNKTGGASVKGTLVSASTAVDNAFILQANEFDTIGAVYEAGIADGSECWIVISGRAQVLMKNTVASTRGNVLIAADTDGRANSIANPGQGVPATETHFKECGHFIETKTGGTDVLAYAVLHFN